MCRLDWCVGSVLDVTMAILGAVADGEPAEHALCTCLAHELGASAAAYIAVDPGTSTATVIAWPHNIDILGMKVILDRLPHAFPLLLRHLVVDRRATCLSADADPESWRGTVAAMMLHEVLGCQDIAQVPLDASGSTVRLAVLARRQSFDDRTMHILNCLRQPLTAVFGVVAHRPPGPSALPTNPDTGDPGLTARELEVLRMVAQGLLARTIAARLEVSPRTVHKHLGNVYRKLDAHDRLVAVRRAESLGLLASSSSRARGAERAGTLTLRW